jgi:hypothetical protein
MIYILPSNLAHPGGIKGLQLIELDSDGNPKIVNVPNMVSLKNLNAADMDCGIGQNGKIAR